MIPLWPQWGIAYSAQLAALVICGGLLAWLLRLRDPRARWACFEGILILCLCLPLVQMRRPATMQSPAVRLASMVASLQTNASTESVPVAQGRFCVNPQLAIAWLWAAGVALRGAWLLLGLRGLYSLKRTAQPLAYVPLPAQKLLEAIGKPVRILISDRIYGAVTFGLGSGVILLPSRFEGMAEKTQAAILCHELTHVRRRDWILTVIEEFVLVLLWFHPAVWWLIREIQLAREEIVDLKVVRYLHSRDEYVGALLEAAQIRGGRRLAPAASFAWRGQLARRMATILAAESASRWRGIMSLAGVATGTLFVLRVSLIYFPAHYVVHAQSSGSAPIQIESGGDHLLRRARLEYPRWVREERVEGVVGVEVLTNHMGLVLDARVLDGPDDLRRPVLRSVLDWQYDPQATPPGTHQITIRFTLPEPSDSRVLALPEYVRPAAQTNDK